MAQRNTHLLLLLVSIFVLIGLVVLLFLTNPKSEIIISDRMNEFIDLIDKSNIPDENKLIILDIDDTILESSQILGTPTWFYSLLNKLRQNGASKLEAYDIMSKIDMFVQDKVAVKPIEDTTLSSIKYWQKNKMLVMGISSRPTSFEEITSKQLKSLGLDFYNKDLVCVEQNWHNTKGYLKNGVLYANEASTQGDIFRYFLELLTKKCNRKIELIGQANDQKHYVDEIIKLTEENNIYHIAIIYGKATSKRIFDINKSNKELIELEKKYNTQVIPQKYRHLFEQP